MKKVRIIQRKNHGSYRVFFYEGSVRKNKNFATPDEAQRFANEKQNEMLLPEFVQVSDEDRIALGRIKRLGKLNDILKFLELNYRRADGNTSFKEAFDAFIEVKEKTNRRPRTIRDYKIFCSKLESYHVMKIKDFGDSTAAEILRLANTASRKLKMSACLSSLFNWAIEQKICAYNPFKPHTKTDTIKDKQHIRIVTPKQAEALLGALPDKLKAGFALMMFTGVRPNEMFNDDGKPVVTWEDVDFKHRKVLVKAETAKTRSARIMQDLPENLWAWLEAYRGEEGNVISISAGRVAKNRRAACKEAKVKYSQDILRHSFASYGYHYLGAEESVEIMGHVGGFGVFARHYKAIANKVEAEEYFKILP